MKEKMLVKTAMQAAKNAFNPRPDSHGVGAAVLTKSGMVFPGVNIQSAISGLGTCAERAAVYNAVSNGHCNISCLAVYFPSKKFFNPCGACLQLLSEFSQVSASDIRIIEVNSEGKTRSTSLRKILPHSLGPVDLNWPIEKFRKRA